MRLNIIGLQEREYTGVKDYTFGYVAPPGVSQRQFFEQSGVVPLLDSALDGCVRACVRGCVTGSQPAARFFDDACIHSAGRTIVVNIHPSIRPSIHPSIQHVKTQVVLCLVGGTVVVVVGDLTDPRKVDWFHLP